MATATAPPPEVATPAPPPAPAPSRILGPADHGRALSFREFVASSFTEGWLFELARGIVVVTDVPGISHAMIVRRLSRLLFQYDEANPGTIKFHSGGGECRVRLPGMQSDRHPDQAVYLTHPPEGDQPWTRWCPDLVVEVVNRSSDDRDYVEKREEYLRGGVREYWVLDPRRRRMLVLVREGDTWAEVEVAADATYRTGPLPGLEVRPADLLGPAGDTEPA